MNTGDPLVFLISQPRAGSTLLQMVLGNHPSIFAPAEPWLMLHLAFLIDGNRRGLHAPYDSYLYETAVREFAERCLPGGISDVEAAIGCAACDLYSAALKSAGKSTFLDKTPRYYLIIEDLLRIFPQARIVFLLRNPLSVLTSIIKTWRVGRAWDLEYYRTDLLNAPTLLLNGIASAGSRGCVVHYEEFVASPGLVLNQILGHLGLGYVEGMENYGAMERRASVGDSVGVYLAERPNQNSEEKWLRDGAADPVIWRLQKDYLSRLGPDVINRLGYDFNKLAACLDTVRPPFAAMPPSLNLSMTRLGGRHDRFVRRFRCRSARFQFRAFRASRKVIGVAGHNARTKSSAT